MYCAEYTAVERSPKKLVIKSTGPGMNNGWRHIDRVSKKASKAVAGSAVLFLFSYTLLEKDFYELVWRRIVLHVHCNSSEV